MNLNNLKSIIKENNLPGYRIGQIFKFYFSGKAKDWDEVTVLGKDLREILKKEINWLSVEEAKVLKAKDSVKAALKLEDGEIIETVLIRHKDGRNTVCVSSQVGCPMKCSFCATGKSGFKRNLESEEIIDQVLWFQNYLNKEKIPPTPLSQGGKITNIVFMGMGEPLLNYENVMSAIKTMNSADGMNFGARHISISTCGIVPGIKKLSGEKLQINLALSMHAPTDKLRREFMPINDQYNIEEVLKAIDFYIAKTNRRVMIEYLLIAGANDRPEDAKKLALLIKDRPLCYVNLIPYNPTDSKYKKSNKDEVDKFGDVLKANHVKFTIRHSFGEPIEAACGQLARRTDKK